MKNLLVYIHPEKIFVYGTDALIRVQIDNSLELGWKREDILLVTNFDYQYNGVKAMVIGSENYCVHSPTSSTINAIVTLFELGVIGDDLYWFHNIDAFQLEEKIKPNLGIADMATTNSIDVFTEGEKYFGAHRWDNAVVYFKKSSRDIFEQIKKNMNRYGVNEEIALMKVELSEKENPTFPDRIKILNTTYNFCAKTIDQKFEKRYEIAQKPIKIIHFNPFDKRNARTSKFLFNVCVRGQNEIGKALVTEKLSQLLSQYEI